MTTQRKCDVTEELTKYTTSDVTDVLHNSIKCDSLTRSLHTAAKLLAERMANDKVAYTPNSNSPQDVKDWLEWYDFEELVACYLTSIKPTI